MSEGGLVSLVALFAWLVLAGGAFRAHQVGARRTLVIALTWLAIFVGVALVISILG